MPPERPSIVLSTKAVNPVSVSENGIYVSVWRLKQSDIVLRKVDKTYHAQIVQ